MLGPEGGGPVGDSGRRHRNAYSREGDTEARWLARVASEIRSNLTESGAPMLAWTYQSNRTASSMLISVAEEPVGVANRFLSGPSSPRMRKSSWRSSIARPDLDSGCARLLKPFSEGEHLAATTIGRSVSHGWADMVSSTRSTQ